MGIGEAALEGTLEALSRSLRASEKWSSESDSVVEVVVSHYESEACNVESCSPSSCAPGSSMLCRRGEGGDNDACGSSVIVIAVRSK